MVFHEEVTMNLTRAVSLILFWTMVALSTVSRGILAQETEDPATVQRWQPHDFTFSSTREYENPFGVSFEGTLTAPDGSSFVCPGFFDGEGIWKLRVSPTEEGDWKISTRSSDPDLDGIELAFQCDENQNPNVHGGLRINPDHPRHFVFEDGTPYFLLGYECDWLWALGMRDQDISPVGRFLDDLAAHGFNHLILNAYAHDTSWKEGQTDSSDYGPPPFYAWGGSNKKPDHSQFNLEFWRHYDGVIAALYERGIIAHVMIKVYNKKVKWPKKGSVDDDRYFRWLIARYAAYPNIVWDFSKEAHNEKDLEYKKSRLRFLEENDPYHRLITVHDDNDAYESGAYNDLVDFRSDQQHKDFHKKVLSQRKTHEWPVVNVEFGYEHGLGGPEDKTYRVVQPPEEVCTRAWEICMAGGYVAYYYTNTAWDVIRPEEIPPGYAMMRNLKQFFEATEFQSLEPRIDLVDGGYCLANPGHEYVVYVPGKDPVKLDLVGVNEPLTGTWFHPFTAERIETRKFSKGSHILSPPGDWPVGPAVLYLTHGSERQ